MTLQTDVAYRPFSASHAYVYVKLHAQVISQVTAAHQGVTIV